MKKMIALLLSLLMIFSLAACGADIDTDAPSDDQSASSDTKTDDNGNNDDIAEIIDDADDAAVIKEDTPEDTTSVDFEPVVVIDNDDCKIEITGIDPDDFMGYTLKAYFENKTDDTSMTFSVDSASINGVVSDPYFSTDVIAGAKSNDNIYFDTDILAKHGIKDFTDICLTFRVYDSVDYMADDLAYETVHIYPKGQDNAETYVREAQPDDVVLVDNEYVSVTYTGCGYDDFDDFTMYLYVVNKTAGNTTFSLDDVTVNGYMADPYYSAFLPAETSGFCEVSWWGDEFETNGITDVEEISFALNAYDDDNWDADGYINGTYTVTP